MSGTEDTCIADAEIRQCRCGARNRVPLTAQGRPRCAKCRGPLAWVVSATDGDFHTIADDCPLPVLVEFWGVWSGPSRVVAPLVQAAASEFAGRLKIVQVDIELGYITANRLGVRSVPALAVTHRGGAISVHEGTITGDALRSWLEECLDQVGAPR